MIREETNGERVGVPSGGQANNDYNTVCAEGTPNPLDWMAPLAKIEARTGVMTVERRFLC
jgi:hypothetical protein